MRYVSDSDAKQRLAALLDTVQRGPVTIRREDREVAVVISPTDFKRLRSNDVEEFQRFCNRVSARAKARGSTQEMLDVLLNE
ncbi:MAG: type II toxin-antitoxin system Phd/YefM family antitoxin [Gammaproteobacteria bacterium]|nr:type II toxin-antitoxin system Phd/YefM family antitoxin [Gammaproteobacteria bacterium]